MNKNSEWLIATIIAISIALIIRTYGAEICVVEGSSMQPTFANQDRIFLDKVTYQLEDPKHLDIIVFRYPKNPNRQFVKRIIAIPGDTVEIKDNTVYVNDLPLREPYILNNTHSVYPKTIIPSNRYFVLGDNRNNSEDSRFKDVGLLDISNIQGRVLGRIYPFSGAHDSLPH